MPNNPDLMDIKYVIACDDARREDNGKNILIGVYNASILVTQFPAQVAVAFWIQFMPTRLGVVNFDAKLLGPSDAEFFNLSGGIELNKIELSSIVLPAILVSASIPSELTLHFRQNGGDWKVIKTLRIDRREQPAGPVTQAPPTGKSKALKK